MITSPEATTSKDVFKISTLEKIDADSNSHKAQEITFSEPVSSFTVHFYLTDEKLDKNNDVQWQYSQFFRANLDNKGKVNFEFEIVE